MDGMTEKMENDFEFKFRAVSDGDNGVVSDNLIRNVDDITFTRLASILASDYSNIYYLNTEDDSYVEFGASGKDKYLQILGSGSDFFFDTVKNCQRLVYADDQERFLNAFNKEKMMTAIRNGETFTLDYRLVIGGVPEYYNLKVAKGIGDDDKYVVIGVRNIDAQKKRDAAAAAENETYSQIAVALASRYEVIYYVDVVTDEYTEYCSSEEYAKLEVGDHGYDFFGDTQRNMKRDIYPEDYPMMAAEMKKERFLSELDRADNYSITYRLRIRGSVEYVNLRAVRPKNDDRHVIIAVSNIDASVKRENEIKRELGHAIYMANQDGMTGVKNKHAYEHAEEAIDTEIAYGGTPAFAVVVCDVNDLKLINDTKGHAAGDKYIKDACRMICTNFKHSPVYRIGGDEFAAILRGDDFDNRERLMRRLEAAVSENRKNGLAAIAYGIAEYDAFGGDKIVKDVFNRADKAMYEKKKEMKENRIKREEVFLGVCDGSKKLTVYRKTGKQVPNDVLE